MARLLTRLDGGRMGKDVVIAFDHIPKCAGTSFRYFLRKALGCGVFWLVFPGDYFRLAEELRRGAVPRVFAGHAAWGVHEVLPDSRRVAYVTLLRDPLARAISHYRYLVRTFWLDPHCDIATFLLEYEPNYMTQWLGHGDLRRAKERLFRTYRSFGIVERRADSLRCIAHDLGLPAAAPPPERINVSAPDGLHVDATLRRYFRETNADDYELYESAQRELDLRLAELRREWPQAADPPRPERAEDAVQYTETLPDVAAALERGDYDGALRLMKEKDVDALSFESLDFACRLAQQCGAAAEAADFFAAMRRRFPYRITTLYVKFLLSQNQNDAAVAAAADEFCRYLAFPHIAPDSRLFDVALENGCMLVWALSAAGAVTAAKELAQRLAAAAGPERQALVMLLHVLYDCGAFTEVLRLSARLTDLDANNALCCLWYVAMALYQQGDFDRARECCDKILRRLPWNPRVLALAVVIDRRSSAFSLPPDRCERLLAMFPGAAFTAYLAREIAVHHYAAGDHADALALLERQASPLREMLIRAVEAEDGGVPFEAFNPEGCLVIKAGADIVFEYLCAELLRRARSACDVIGALPAALPPELAPSVTAAAALPPGRYVHAEHFARINADLGERRYDRCIVVTSEFRPECFTEILKLARALCPGDVFLYSLDHMFSKAFRHHLTRIAPPQPAPSPAA